MAHLPGALKAVSGLETVVITPYHHKIQKTRDLVLEWLGAVSVPFDGKPAEVKVGRLVDRDGVSWIFLRAADERFYAGVHHPYDLSHDNLLRDALFFGAAAARALALLDPAAEWIAMMQDWEGSTIQLAVDNMNSGCRPFLTLHNSYDSGGVAPGALARVGIDPASCPGPASSSQASVLERVLMGNKEKVFTVSQLFAADLAMDVYQTKVMAPHLQELLKERLVGVDNGPFANLAVDEDILDQALAGHYGPLLDWKKERKAAAVAAMEIFAPSTERPVWGDLGQFKESDSPWFLMAGRDDPRQKGYDVAALAIKRYLKSGGPGHFLFFPIPGDEGQVGLGFLKKLAALEPGRVLVMPFIFREGFMMALQGATFGVMPSLYEPFGMANEFYLNGTPGIGRATGGIIQQIVPWRKAKAFTPSVEKQVRNWYSSQQPPSGVLFREPEDLPTEVADWREINEASYNATGGYPDRLVERSRLPLVKKMADQLGMALKDGVSIYQDPPVYASMLAQGVRQIQANFSWVKAAEKYWRLIF
jgi:glycogen synthase